MHERQDKQDRLPHRKDVTKLVQECRKHGPLYEQNPKIVAHVSRTSKWLLNAITKMKTELNPKETS